MLEGKVPFYTKRAKREEERGVERERERERLREVESERARDHEQNGLLLYIYPRIDQPTDRPNERVSGAKERDACGTEAKRQWQSLFDGCRW